MPGNVYATNVAPENLQWWGWGRELTAGTAVLPSVSMPLEKGLPVDKPNPLVDKSLRGYMGNDYGVIFGTGSAEFPLSGDVYMDSIGHPLYNIFGDYQTSGSTPTSATTLSAQANAGATTMTVAAIGTIATGSNIQVGTTGTSPYEVVTVLSVAANVITLNANTPLRMTHASGAAVAIVAAPFTHTFALLNGGGAFGLPATAQPPTHTVTYHNNLAATTLARQYAYWCASGMDFKLSSEQLFMHDTKGMSVLGAIAASTPSNTQGGIVAVPNWEFKVGVGGPASGGTLLNNVLDATVSIERGLKAQFALNGQQAPYIIARLGMSITGKLTIMAIDESPLLSLLGGANPQQLQIAMTQGANLGFTFNAQLAEYETVAIAAPDVLVWEVSFRAVMNSTNAGASSGMSPGNIVLINSVPTF